jgi:hypothetical protein
MGNSAVAGMGTASLIHQTAIQAAIPSMYQAGAPRPVGTGSSRKTASAAGPAASAIIRAVIR